MEVDSEMDTTSNGQVNGSSISQQDWPGRWNHVQKLLKRKGPFNGDNFDPSLDIFNALQEFVRVLVVGAGGLGCELLKDLALMGFKNIDVIDMDTIDISNLNRQFLFRQKDVGRFKAEVAAEFINQRVPGTNVTPHNCKIQEKDEDFYRQFHIVICGLDSIVARRWINGMVISLLHYDDDGELDRSTMKPIIDGGTEGFKGNARVIYPGISACIDCTLDLFPPQINFPLCTIAHTPRLPEHCIEYVRMLLWNKENPFTKEGEEQTPIDGDDPQHITWIHEKANERAAQFNISGVTYRLTQGVIKHIIPAVASTNAVIAAAVAMEAFKIITACANPLSNYMVFNQTDSIYTYAYEAEKNENCLACSQKKHCVTMKSDSRLQDFIDLLTTDARYQMKSPAITTINPETGRNKTLYMASIESIEKATRPNLKKTLQELGLVNGSEVVVADSTTPNPVEFKIGFS